MSEVIRNIIESNGFNLGINNTQIFNLNKAIIEICKEQILQSMVDYSGEIKDGKLEFINIAEVK